MCDASMPFRGECDPMTGLCGPNNGSQNFELRNSRVYTNCDCWRRNGLQDNCPRTLCQSKSGCMNLPSPNCGPSAYPLRVANITMGNHSYCEPSKNDFKQLDVMYGSPMNGYQGYQGDVPIQQISTYPSSDGMQSMNQMNSMSNMNAMVGMSGVSGMSGMNGMSGMSGMNGFNDVQNWSGGNQQQSNYSLSYM